MATDKPRLSISMDEKTFEKVIAYKEEEGIATQSKAIIKIMEIGLNELEKEIAQKNSPSAAEAILGEEFCQEVTCLAGRLSPEQKDLFLAILRLTAARNQGLSAADLVSAGETALKSEHQNPSK